MVKEEIKKRVDFNYEESKERTKEKRVFVLKVRGLRRERIIRRETRGNMELLEKEPSWTVKNLKSNQPTGYWSLETTQVLLQY